jgi:non-lysosomal glucosylceramidase
MHTWPFLKEYRRENLLKVAMPIGGIGTGTVSLGGRGDLRDWELMNRPSKGFTPQQGDSWFGAGPSIILHTCDAAGTRQTRLLEGPIDPVLYDGQAGCSVNNHNFPHMQEAIYRTAYPLAEIEFACDAIPLDVRLRAFNPMIPCNVADSSIPGAVFRYTLRNNTAAPVTASICFSLPNYIGADHTAHEETCYSAQHEYGPKQNTNEFRRSANFQGILLSSQGVPRQNSTYGTIALTTTTMTDCSHRTDWADLSWGDTLLDFWDDLTADGALDARTSNKDDPVASLCPRVVIPAGGEEEILFFLSWHFPNRLSWEAKEFDGQSATESEDSCGDECSSAQPHPDWVGNHYCTVYEDAWHVAEKELSRLAELEKQTVEFVGHFLRADVPAVIREAALFNLSTLRTQTCFRTADGYFYGWEGTHNYGGCCYGSCTHVWNYEQGLGFFYGELSRLMREAEFKYSTTERGQIQTRITLPIEKNLVSPFFAAADGQLGVIMRFYRDWQLSGSEQFLAEHWPTVRKAIEFCWIEHGWDADQDGVVEGCQHNTMDVEYFGPNPQMGFWYLGALRAGEEMAKHSGQDEFAATCRRLFVAGKAWMEKNLFNGEYFEHKIIPPGKGATIDAGIIGDANRDDLDDPVLQLGPACLVDQLVGQYMAHACGLGYLLEPELARKTLTSIRQHNWRGSFLDHFNHFRSYAVGDEKGLLMASYPRGGRPQRPFPYCNELMTGFEHSTAVHMLYEGMEEEGLECIAAIRERYDGRRRNPYDEAECGHHYVRALASWGGILAWSGFAYSAVTGALRVGRAGTFFFSTGDAWGTYELKTGAETVLRIVLRGGRLKIRTLTASNGATTSLADELALSTGDDKTIVLPTESS